MTATDAPAPITDRPLGVIDLLDGAFHALRQRPQTLVLAAAWVVVPGALLQLVLDTQVLGTEPATLSNGFGLGGDDVLADSIVVRFVIGWFVTCLAGVSVARIVGGWLASVDTSAAAAITYTLRRLPVIVAAFLLGHVAILVGTALCIIPGFFVMAMFSMSSPVIAMEESTGPVAALRRSWRLARANSFAVYGLIIAVFMTGLVLQGGLFFVVSLFSGLSDQTSLVINTVVTLVGQLLLIPLNGAAMSLLYLDGRFRTEGFDLELRARSVFPRG